MICVMLKYVLYISDLHEIDLYEHINQYVHVDYTIQPKFLNIVK